MLRTLCLKPLSVLFLQSRYEFGILFTFRFEPLYAASPLYCEFLRLPIRKCFFDLWNIEKLCKYFLRDRIYSYEIVVVIQPLFSACFQLVEHFNDALQLVSLCYKVLAEQPREQLHKFHIKSVNANCVAVGLCDYKTPHVFSSEVVKIANVPAAVV